MIPDTGDERRFVVNSSTTAVTPQHGQPSQPTTRSSRRTKTLVLDRESCHLDDVLADVASSFTLAVLDKERRGEVFEGRGRRRVERAKTTAGAATRVIDDPEIPARATR